MDSAPVVRSAGAEPRRSRRSRALSAPALLAAIAFVGCTDDGSAMFDSGPAGEDFGIETLSPHSEPGDGGAVEVVEDGFTALDPSGMGVSYAVVLENSSAADALAQAEVRLQLLDDSGEPLTFTEPADSDVETQLSGGALPGARAAVSGLVYLEETPAEMVVWVEGTQWFPVAEHPDPGDVVADDVAVTQDDGRVQVAFTAESSFSEPKSSLAVHAVFRDSSGEVIGGTQSADSEVVDFPPGETAGEIGVDAAEVPPDVDGSRTEVYVG